MLNVTKLLCHLLVVSCYLIGINVEEVNSKERRTRQRSHQNFQSVVKFLDIQDCVSLPDGIYADPTDCHRYYHCNRGKTYYFRCYDGFVFHPCALKCAFRDMCVSKESCSSHSINWNGTFENSTSTPEITADFKNDTRSSTKEFRLLRLAPSDSNDIPTTQSGRSIVHNNENGELNDVTAETVVVKDKSTGGKLEDTTDIPLTTQGTTEATMTYILKVVFSRRNQEERKNQNELESTTTFVTKAAQTDDSRLSTSDSLRYDLTTEKKLNYTFELYNNSSELSTSLPEELSNSTVRSTSNDNNSTTDNRFINTTVDSVVTYLSNTSSVGVGETLADKAINSTEQLSHNLTSIFNETSTENEVNGTRSTFNATEVESASSETHSSATATTDSPSTVNTETTSTGTVSNNATSESISAPTTVFDMYNSSSANDSSVFLESNNVNSNDLGPARNFIKSSGIDNKTLVETSDNSTTNAFTEKQSTVRSEESNISSTLNEDSSTTESETNSTTSIGSTTTENSLSTSTEKETTIEESSVKTEETKSTEKNAEATISSSETLKSTTIGKETSTDTSIVNVTIPVQQWTAINPEVISNLTINCTSTISSAMCESFDNQTRESLERKCSTLSCQNGGMFIALSNGHCGCVCTTGWKGESCQDIVDTSVCRCANGGRCVKVTNDTFACMCPLGLLGAQCQYNIDDIHPKVSNLVQLPSTPSGQPKVNLPFDNSDFMLCPTNSCFNGGVCLQSLTSDEKRCFCADSYGGKSCEKKCINC